MLFVGCALRVVGCVCVCVRLAPVDPEPKVGVPDGVEPWSSNGPSSSGLTAAAPQVEACGKVAPESVGATVACAECEEVEPVVNVQVVGCSFVVVGRGCDVVGCWLTICALLVVG